MKLKIVLLTRISVVTNSQDFSGYFIYHQFVTFINSVFCTRNAFMCLVSISKEISVMSVRSSLF
jgi:hypothetical protein